jgi:hypothetical protein
MKNGCERRAITCTRRIRENDKKVPTIFQNDKNVPKLNYNLRAQGPITPYNALEGMIHVRHACDQEEGRRKVEDVAQYLKMRFFGVIVDTFLRQRKAAIYIVVKEIMNQSHDCLTPSELWESYILFFTRI